MRARSLEGAVGAVLVVAGARAAWWALARADGVETAVWLVATVVGAFLLLRRLRRVACLAILVLATASTALTVRSLHEALRGEREIPPPSSDSDLAPEDLEPPPGRAVRIAVWSDARGGASIFERVVDSMRSRDPRVVVGLGDLVGMARVHSFVIQMERLVPRFPLGRVVTVPGNHDRDPGGTLHAYSTVWGPPSWHFRFADCLLVAVDSSEGRLSPDEVARVERVLDGAAETVRHRMLFCHFPPFPPAGRADKALPDDAQTRRLRDAIRRHRAHVFSGNLHSYDVTDLGGHHQVVTGGAGSKPEGDVPYHWVQVDVDERGLRFERVEVAAQGEESPWRERRIAVRDEAPYAARAEPSVTTLGFASLGLALGSFAALVVPRRRRQRLDTVSSA